MTVGLPGTGIGGLYYFLLVLWMPFHDLGRRLRDRRHALRWGPIGRSTAIAAGILASLSGEVWLLERALLWAALRLTAGSYWRTSLLAARTAVTPAAATLVALGVLGGVLLAVQVFRVWLWIAQPPVPSLHDRLADASSRRP
jgi:hypothetical protein